MVLTGSLSLSHSSIHLWDELRALVETSCESCAPLCFRKARVKHRSQPVLLLPFPSTLALSSKQRAVLRQGALVTSSQAQGRAVAPAKQADSVAKTKPVGFTRCIQHQTEQSYINQYRLLINKPPHMKWLFNSHGGSLFKSLH